MEDNEILGFSWSTLFIVTTVCCSLFTGILYLLDGKLSMIFLSIALSSLALSILNWILIRLKRPVKKNVEAEYVYRD